MRIKRHEEADRSTGWYKEQQEKALQAENYRLQIRYQDPVATYKAEANWAKVKHQPLALLAMLSLLSAGGASFCLGGGPAGYIGVGLFAIILIGAVVRLNQSHRNAYIERQISRGMSPLDAQRDYDQKYSS
jgi:hypothetical protein